MKHATSLLDSSKPYQLLINDTQQQESNYSLLGYRGKKSVNSGVIYIPYIPAQIVETPVQQEARIKKERAGKTYAKVKLSNGNSHYRHKRGKVLEYDPKTKKYCLEIETVNTCSENGHYTLIGVCYPHGYEKIWFNEDELTNFEHYDANGDKL